MCRALPISRSCYYNYCSNSHAAKGSSGKTVEARVVGAFQLHKRRYGVRRLVPELLGQGLKIGRYKVAGILRRNGLKAIQPKSFVPRTTDSRHPYPISPNLLKDKPLPLTINQVWDITYIPLKSGGWCYLAVWMDLFSRKVTGWQLLGHMKEPFVVEAFKKAWGNRNAGKGLVVHSDRGGQYAGKNFRKLLGRHHVSQCMSGVDNPYETYYNPVRRHSSLGYISPVAFEQKVSYTQKTEV